jgi:F0F1-type ATP synthase delta subunit
MRITPQQYALAWYTALQKSPRSEWDRISRSVIRTVHHQGKMKWLREIVRAVERLEGRATGKTAVTVRLAYPHHEKIVEDLVQTILKTKEAHIHTVIDPDLIGGAQVETENSRWDLSLRGALRSLEKTINA